MSDNKKYYYIKLKDNYFEQDNIKALEAQKNGYIYSLIILKLYLKSAKYNGQLKMSDMIPYRPEDVEVLAKVLGHDIDHVKEAIRWGVKLGLIIILDTKEIWMTEMQNFIGKSSTEADRIREYRNRLKGVQMYNKNTPEIEIEKEIDIELDKDKEIEKEKEFKNKEKNLENNKSIEINPSSLNNKSNKENIVVDNQISKVEEIDLKNNLNYTPLSNKEYHEQKKRFEVFWSKYPKKRRIKKADTEKLWMELRPNESTFKKILGGLERYNKSQIWADGYITSPYKWLAEKRWQDDVEPVERDDWGW